MPKKCLHQKPQDLGETQWGMAVAVVEWCPECGAQRKKMTDWEYRTGRWILPKREAKEKC